MGGLLKKISRISCLGIFLVFIFSMPVFAKEDSNFGFLSEGIGITPKAAKALNIKWLRPHPGNAVWDTLEPEQGTFEWTKLDRVVKKAQKKDLQLLITIWPYADWDQESCHKNSKDAVGFEYELPLKRDVPCDFTAYQNFLTKLVERYDGDGLDDMDNLEYGIKYWEILNEPEFNEGDLVFFQGTANDYYKILKNSYQAIKAADENSKVVLAGMASTWETSEEFWQKVFAKDSKLYFDIGNMHSITSQNPSFNARYYKNLLAQNNINKPFWVTEVQLDMDDGLEAEEAEREQAADLVRGYVKAFKAGAKKIYYTIYEADAGSNFAESALLFNGNKKPLYYALETLIDKVDNYSHLTKIAENQYRFKIKNKFIYVLWGNGSVPEALINETVKVTDILGNKSTLSGNDLSLTDEPIYVEIIN